MFCVFCCRSSVILKFLFQGTSWRSQSPVTCKIKMDMNLVFQNRLRFILLPSRTQRSDSSFLNMFNTKTFKGSVHPPPSFFFFFVITFYKVKTPVNRSFSIWSSLLSSVTRYTTCKILTFIRHHLFRMVPKRKSFVWFLPLIHHYTYYIFKTSGKVFSNITLNGYFGK